MTTERLYDIMQAIHDLSRERGFPPTVREIGKKVGYASTATVQEGIDLIKHRGWALSDARTARSIRLTEDGMSMLAVRSS